MSHLEHEVELLHEVQAATQLCHSPRSSCKNIGLYFEEGWTNICAEISHEFPHQKSDTV